MTDPVEACTAARAAQPTWVGRDLDDRRAVVGAFRALIDERRDDLARLLTDDMGKPIAQARAEVGAVLGRIDVFADRVASVVEPESVHDEGGMREVITHEPLGVIANISAWNYPWFVGANVFVPALLTGNAVLYKPSEVVPRTGAAIAALLHEAGVPEDVFVLVEGGPEVGADLVRQSVDGVFFTGSYATGRRIAEAVAGRMVRVQLELGGKDPVYVADDVDVAAAVASIADGAFANAGQSCCSVERIYVHDTVFDRFVEAFVATAEGFTVGDPHDEATYLGPLARPQQVEVLAGQVADAVERGARVLTGGRVVDVPTRAGVAADHVPGAGVATEGRAVWFAPTVLVGVDNTMSVMRDESFGPIIGIGRVADDDEAVAAMNDTEFGLTAGVYSRDETRARRVLSRLDTGSAYWNCCDRVSPRLPWSGRRHSGMGTTLGVEGIRSFTTPRSWHLRG